MKKLLRLKHWQIFGLIIIIPPLMILSGSILFKLTGINSFNFVFPFLATMIMAITYFGWIWSITVNLYKYKSRDLQFDLDKFKTYFRLSLIIFFIIIPFSKVFLGANSGLISFVLGLTSISLFFYCIYLTSTITNSLSKKNEKEPNNLFIDFLLIWILPIGIWMVQPKINQLLTDELDDQIT